MSSSEENRVEEEGEDSEEEGEIVEVEEEVEESGEEVEVVEVVEEVTDSESEEEQEVDDGKKDDEEEEEVSDDEKEESSSDEEEEEKKKKTKKKKKKKKEEEEEEPEEGDRTIFTNPPINLIPKKRKKKGKDWSDEQKREIAEEAREMRRIYRKYFTIKGGATEEELMFLLTKKKITPLMLLPKAPSDLYAQDAFIYCCMMGYRKTAMYLFKKRYKDCDPNSAEAKALRHMCGMKDPDMKLITMMIADKQRCEIHNRNNMALINACRMGHEKIVEMLINAKIGGRKRKQGVSASDKEGQALIYAVASGKPMIVKLLLGMKSCDPTTQKFAAVKQASKSLGDILRKIKLVETKKFDDEKKKGELLKKGQEKARNYQTIIRLLLLDDRMSEHLASVIKQ